MNKILIFLLLMVFQSQCLWDFGYGNLLGQNPKGEHLLEGSASGGAFGSTIRKLSLVCDASTSLCHLIWEGLASAKWKLNYANFSIAPNAATTLPETISLQQISELIPDATEEVYDHHVVINPSNNEIGISWLQSNNFSAHYHYFAAIDLGSGTLSRQLIPGFFYDTTLVYNTSDTFYYVFGVNNTNPSSTRNQLVRWQSNGTSSILGTHFSKIYRLNAAYNSGSTNPIGVVWDNNSARIFVLQTNTSMTNISDATDVGLITDSKLYPSIVAYNTGWHVIYTQFENTGKRNLILSNLSSPVKLTSDLSSSDIQSVIASNQSTLSLAVWGDSLDFAGQFFSVRSTSATNESWFSYGNDGVMPALYYAANQYHLVYLKGNQIYYSRFDDSGLYVNKS